MYGIVSREPLTIFALSLSITQQSLAEHRRQEPAPAGRRIDRGRKRWRRSQMSEQAERPNSKSAAPSKPRKLAKDVPYPEHLKVAPPPYRPRVMRVPVERYFTREMHDREVE